MNHHQRQKEHHQVRKRDIDGSKISDVMVGVIDSSSAAGLAALFAPSETKTGC